MKPATQAGKYVKKEMRRYEEGSGNIKSRKQAIAVGLSEARRAGVKLAPPKKGKTSESTRRRARTDLAVGSGEKKVSASRSRGAKQAAATRERRYSRSKT
ncbi:MAG TPA: DUF6496 domain-containing protein [Opitutaceae bacterium]|nr:DUF6496 domain-containing protein [Opitutaceae bacterium]